MTSDTSGIVICPLTAETWDSVAELFAQGGDPKWCWCMFWRLPSGVWSKSSADGNRKQLHHLTTTGGASPGLMALRGGEAIGWVSLGPRDDFERLERSRTITRTPGDGVWSLVCFVVGRRERRSGVASRLLEGAVDHATRNGARILEAYPVRTGGERIISASVYTGTLGMFERAGFTVVAETTSKADGHPRVVVRRDLDVPPA